MGLLNDLSTKYKTISIVGMAKNAGKTTALNYLIEEAIDEGMILGITSTGRDGETQDLVTGTEKPRVYVDRDMLVAVPSLLYDMADAGLEVIRKTKYSTAIGEPFSYAVSERPDMSDRRACHQRRNKSSSAVICWIWDASSS